MSETPRSFVFDRKLLNPKNRRDGISAFTRVRNGEDFLHLSVLSHIAFFDELIIVYNQCTDRTPLIARRLEAMYPDKIRVIHYEPRVHALGSPAHAQTPPESLHSMVNYSNFALSQTTCRVVTKLDDDHLAIPSRLSPVVQRIRNYKGCNGQFLSQSGLNISGDIENGETLVYANEPFSGSGDYGFFDINENTHFEHGRHNEVASAAMKKNRSYSALSYYHLKFLKPHYGFSNYELGVNNQSRYKERLKKFLENAHFQSMEEFCEQSRRELKINSRTAKGKTIKSIPPAVWRRLRYFPMGKIKLLVERGLRLPDELVDLPTPQQIMQELQLDYSNRAFVD